ncbi:class D sortase [Anoxynatronum sibiricum]|uniref:Class D sortase n=1 Tax=Anoxynatronum sibiricum TaxID=210623 RepID=A0ABU9VPI9_9CLOT
MKKTARMRLMLWILVIVFATGVAVWELWLKPEPPETPEQPSVEEPTVPDLPELPEPEAEPEEPTEPAAILIPEFAANQVSSGSALGRLEIPAINFNMAVIADATPANLNRAPALMKSTHMPGAPGNAVISGHRMYEFGSHLNRLDELDIDDWIYFSNETTAYHFQVEQITVVDPAEIWITLGDQRETRLTLFACTPIRIATHRLVVFAVLKDEIAL